MEQNDLNALLHILRNPEGWGEETVREARLKAADELQRLYRNERAVKAVSEELAGIVAGK